VRHKKSVESRSAAPPAPTSLRSGTVSGPPTDTASCAQHKRVREVGDAAPPAPTSLRSGTVSGPHLSAKRRKLGHYLDMP
jgi:hypothetical protein